MLFDDHSMIFAKFHHQLKTAENNKKFLCATVAQRSVRVNIVMFEILLFIDTMFVAPFVAPLQSTKTTKKNKSTYIRTE